MPFNAFARHRPSRKAYHRRNAIPWLAMASDSRRATDECELPPLDIGVRAMQLSPYRAGVAGPCHTRLLTSPAFQPCCCSLALSGLGEAVASESSALNSGLLRRQFLPCVTRRTLSPHTAHERRILWERSISPTPRNVHRGQLARSLGTFVLFPDPLPQALRHVRSFPTLGLLWPI
jgi:hypothetical protein